MMKLQITIVPDTLTLCLVGDLDLYNAEDAREALLHHLADQPRLDVDLAGLNECDTAGLQLLLSARCSAVAAGKPFSLVTPAPLFEKSCELLGLPSHTWTPHAN